MQASIQEDSHGEEIKVVEPLEESKSFPLARTGNNLTSFPLARTGDNLANMPDSEREISKDDSPYKVNYSSIEEPVALPLRRKTTPI